MLRRRSCSTGRLTVTRGLLPKTPRDAALCRRTNQLTEYIVTVTFDDSDKFSLRDDLVVEEIDGDVVVLDLEGNQYFGLNEVAWTIWRDIRESDRSFGEIVDAITDSFGIDRGRARGDVSGFVESLVDAGLATRRESPES